MMARVRTASALGLAAGALGVLLSLVPPISSLEDTLGLRWLFQARGSRPSPPGVVVVSIDEQAAARLDLPPLVRDWPRATHARLIDRLIEQGVSVIVFDLQFLRDTSVADDAALAGAIARSQRVVLVQFVEPVAAGHGLWRNPIPALASGAVGLAPVPIPDTPVVSWFWSFLTTGGQEFPTLPAVALQAGAMRVVATLSDAWKSAGVDVPDPQINTSGELLAYMRGLRRLLKGNTSALSGAVNQLATTPQLDSQEKQLARAVAALYASDGASYLNFYGPPGTVCTVPYEVVYEGAASPCPLNGATVFVGVGRSRRDRAEQIDTYHTIYERSDGVDFSGVELHATAFANLLTGTALRPLNRAGSFAILLGAGIVLGGTGYWTRTRRRRLRGGVPARVEAAVILALLIGAYWVMAYVLFARYSVSVPIVVPLALQLPTALILGLVARPFVHGDQAHAVCLAADAGGSTAVGQRLPHDAYATLMTEYNRVLAHCVTTRGGLALPPHGDGFVALWILGGQTGDVTVRLTACQAALEMVAAADRFNAARAESERLPLRLGLTVGEVTVRSDADRGAFEAVGDAVNVAARLQQVNRELGTSVLASAPLVQDLSAHLQLRRIDVPLTLKGVKDAPDVFELAVPRAFI